MKKIHLCCGDVYLDGYENCDIDGYRMFDSHQAVRNYLNEECDACSDIIYLENGNPNITDLDHYFKFPFETEVSKRVRRPFIIDTKMNILATWQWADQSVDEIVSVSAFEHFEHLTELPHIISEAHRVLKPGGIWKFDFPDVKQVVEDYYDAAPEFCMELIDTTIL